MAEFKIREQWLSSQPTGNWYTVTRIGWNCREHIHFGLQKPQLRNRSAIRSSATYGLLWNRKGFVQSEIKCNEQSNCNVASCGQLCLFHYSSKHHDKRKTNLTTYQNSYGRIENKNSIHKNEKLGIHNELESLPRLKIFRQKFWSGHRLMASRARSASVRRPTPSSKTLRVLLAH